MSIGMCFEDLFVSRVDRRYMDMSETLMEYEKLEIEVKRLTGFNFEMLKKLFAAGWTLTPPKYESLEGLVELHILSDIGG